MNGAHDDSRLEFEAAVAADDVKEWWTVLGGFEYKGMMAGCRWSNGD
jgi:hypothetical protein